LPLSIDSRVKTDVKVKSVHVLSITSVISDDVGEYKVVAKNESGEAVESFNLTLSSKIIFT
jgi:hypothetical protein